MTKQFTISIEIEGTTNVNKDAFAILLNEAAESLLAKSRECPNMKLTISEVDPTPAPVAPAAPAPPKAG